jgi:hypothetical protein
VYQFADPAAGTFINDVALTRNSAWFTDSMQHKLYQVPLGRGGAPGAANTLLLSGPATAMPMAFNLSGVSVPNVDGILLEAGRLFAVQNLDNKVAVMKLSNNLSSGVIEQFITNDNFHVPTTIARFGDRQLALRHGYSTQCGGI